MCIRDSTYTVENTGDVNINDVSIDDQHTSAAGTSTLPVSGEEGDPGNSVDSTDATENDGTWDVIAPGDIITFTSTYVVTEADANAENDITSIATVTGTPAEGAFGPDPITASESVSVFTPSLYPLTPQTVDVCTVDANVYSETFDDGSNGGFTYVSQNKNYPYGLLDAQNNLFNLQDSLTDVTIHPNLNGISGVPSPSGGGFLGSFDAQGGEPTWVTSIANEDWSGATDGGISFEFWNYYPNSTAANYADQILYFQIIGTSSTGKIVFDLDISTVVANLSAGEWITIETLFDTSEPWLHYTSTNPRTESGWTVATDAQILSVLEEVTAISISPESGAGGNVVLDLTLSPPEITGGADAINAERYAVDTIQVFSCSDSMPDLSASKSVEVWDPLSEGLYAIPGNDVIYTISVANNGSGSADSDSMFLVDRIPDEIEFWNGDIDAGGSDTFTGSSQIGFVQSAGTGVTFDPATDLGFVIGPTRPSSFADCTSVAQDGAYRGDINYVCLAPKGTLSTGDPNPTVEFSFRGRIN